MSLVLLPVGITFIFSDTILIALAQDPVISKMARDYVTWCLPGVIMIIQFDCTKRYL